MSSVTNIRLGEIGLAGTKTQAYDEHLLITPVKSFITLGPGVNESFMMNLL